MSGVFSGGASEQAPSMSVSAAPHARTPLILLISILRLAGSPARRRARETHRGAVINSIGRIFDYAVVRREAGGELDDPAQVPFDRHRLHRHAIVGIHSGDGEPVGVEY